MSPVRVAIVDDHVLVCEGLAHLLALVPGFDVVGTCPDGATAIRLVREATPDVVLLDLLLPDVHGLDMIAPLLAASPKTRIVVLSVQAEPEVAAEAVERGAKGLLSKTASPEELVAAVRRAAAGETIEIGAPPTARERDILAAVAEGWTNDRIACELGLTPKTVEGYVQRLMDRTGVHTRTGLVAYGRRIRLGRT